MFSANAQDERLVEKIINSKEFNEFTGFSAINKSNFVSSSRLKGGDESILLLSFDVNRDKSIDYELFYIENKNLKVPILALKKYSKDNFTLYSHDAKIILSASYSLKSGKGFISVDDVPGPI